MKFSTTSSIAICASFSSIILSSVNAAGPHNRFGINSHRRHHARAAAASAESELESTSIPEELETSIIEERDQCTLGAWQCRGSELHRCYNDQWNFVTNCTGTDIICSDGLYTTGCVWTWSVQQNDDANESATSSPPFTSSVTATAISSATYTETASVTNGNLVAQPSATAGTGENDEEECDDEDDQDEDEDENEDEEDDDYEDCEDDDQEDQTSTYIPATPVVTTVSTAASSTIPSQATPTPSVIGGQLIAGGNDGQSDNDNDDDDEEECDEYDPDTEEDSASPSTTASATASTSIIGGQLWAGESNTWDNQASSTSQEWNSWDQATATATSSSAWGNGHGHGKGHKSSSADWNAPTASSWDQSSEGSSSISTNDEWSTATTTNSWDQWSGQPTTSAAWGQQSSIASSGKIGQGSATASASASATSKSSGKGSNSTTGSPSSSYSNAPHYVIYSDYWLTEMPSVDVLSNFNRFILAFWMTNTGAVDNAQFWEQLDSQTRQQVLSDYHNAGIALMVSAFGSTDSPTSNGADPTQTAQQLAQWVKQYGLDGVDIDYEDMPAMNSAKAVAWLVTFQKELRRQLPAPYIISHAPVAPWFTSANDYSDGAYTAIHQQTGDGIDFYNIQFYNQGQGVYEDCNSLLFNSGNDWPSTSVFEINSSAGLPLDKIVIGKPLDEGAAANGFVDPSILHKCVSQAQAKGWNAGVMFWEWTSSAPSVMGTVRGTN
ncbi:uncharacterized protein L201_007946 [Kwoniella dendrophila CBS 6074]|uniref:GH18 domain-containing protein n=1 Tax=Kwoniella dendrophila CBS 6074 TaxID=1295534 RepID=A0AAX4K7Z5_9TREE